MKVVGSAKELEKLSGQEVTDLHKHIVDKIKFPCKNCDGEMVRIPDVLDTWFDSGSMPYAQIHYPFEKKKKFQESFPAEFIAEGVDQTRAWFYYLHVLSTAVKQSPAFKNVIVNGIVLAEDGKKMSKRLQNYPDPTLMFNKYGADAMRFYLLYSPVMYAENLNFKESEMSEVYRGMFRMLWNSYSFFVLYANIDKWQVSKSASQQVSKSENLLDKWIISELNTLIKDVNAAMGRYELSKAARFFPSFVDNLSNWYIRRSRKRFWKSESDSDKEQAYHTLYEVFVALSKLLAPFTPFIAEEIFKNLTGKESVHLEDYPVSDKKLIDMALNKEMNQVRLIVEKGLSERAKAGIKVRQPLGLLRYGDVKLHSELEQIIADEVNVREAKWIGGNKSELSKPMLDLEITSDLKLEGNAREMIRNIQSLRKKSGFNVDDRIIVYYETGSSDLLNTMKKLNDLIAKEVLALEINNDKKDSDGEEEFVVEGNKIWIGLKKIVN